MGFKVHKASVLSDEEQEALLVCGAGLNISAMLQKQGAVTGEPCAAIMISVETGKIKGSTWVVDGNLGQVGFSTGRVGGSRT